MTITVTDPETGTEINLGPSDVRPGRIRVTIFAPTTEGVAKAFVVLREEFGVVGPNDFTQPALCADGRWGCIGTVG